MYFSINHGESAYGIEEWIEEEHGVDSKHFSVWSRGESEDRWGHAGRLTGAMMPKSFTIAEYDINEENERKAPTGYKTYEYCGIAVDATVWEDYDIDYTRDEGYKQLSILEKSLLTTSYNLERIADILARMLDRMGSE